MQEEHGACLCSKNFENHELCEAALDLLNL
jgi:hypothetical protein